MLYKTFTILFFVLSLHQTAVSQQNPQFKSQKERILQEKLRIKDLQLLQEMVTAFYANPSNHQNTFTSPSHSTSAQDRNGEVVVHGGAEVESEVHAAINPSDTANIIVGSILSDAENLENPLDVPIYYTTDFGNSWDLATFNSNPNAEFVAGGGDPVFAFDKDGKAYISWLILAISEDFNLKLSLYMASSTDKGANWTFNTTPIDIGEASIFTEEGEFVDKQWMAVDQNPASIYEGRLYTIYVRLNATSASSEINLKWKEKTATTFSPRIKVHQGTYAFMQFSSVDVAKNGDVHVLFTAGNSENDVALYHAKSTDGGSTFAPEEKISDLIFNSLFADEPATEIEGIEPTRLYPCPHLKCGQAPNEVYATWSCKGIDAAGTTGYDVYFAKSTDSGATWASAKRIGNTSTDVSHQYYPSIGVSPTGKICITYYDRTEDPTGTNTHYNITISNDGGSTFTTGTNVTTTPSDFGVIGDQNQGFGIGEYTQVVTTGSYAIPVWSDGRSGGGDIDVYAALVNITGAVSVDELTTVSDQFELQIVNPTSNFIKVNAILHASTKLKWEVIDTQGKLITSITNELSLPPGRYAETIQVPDAGVYFVSLTTEYGRSAKKVIVLK